MNELLNLLKENCPGVDFENSNSLVDDEILESLDIVTIVSAIMDEYNVEVSVEDLIPENFNSVSAIYDLITRLKG